MTELSTRSSPVQRGPDGPYIQIPGQDLRLTNWKESDMEAAVELNNHPDIGKWACFRPYPYKPEDYDYRLNLISAHNSSAELFLSDTAPPLSALEKESELPLSAVRNSAGRLVGSCSIGPSQKEQGSWELAYDLHPSLQGKGAGKAMVAALLDLAKWLRIKRVVAFCEPVNLASAGLLKKSGFTYVGEKLQKFPEEKGGMEKVIHGYEKIL
ncbi:uncharacterized protein IL334_000053 [Kwoniella shivajii]|uniref:N-acetyltransferase domain-containing protein n=1 Tax=Kwoniella shivajii TaxID=564305 RepID=A0ABZ1CNG1_9TREE|nr:hypothetical protein IL334_000053 [Kwoniella shivajii]